MLLDIKTFVMLIKLNNGYYVTINKTAHKAALVRMLS